MEKLNKIKLDPYTKFDHIKTIIEKSNLSKINNENIKKFLNYNNWDFIPDYAVIVINKEANSKLEIILINRETKAVGLRSIGEIMSYNRLVNPKFSFLITDKGHSNEISYFMINEKIRSRLIKFGRNSLIIFSFDDNSEKINQESIIPFEYRNIVNGQ